eukprot:scaffold18597_cov100-Isochrysis_galbana.AAC.2
MEGQVRGGVAPVQQGHGPDGRSIWRMLSKSASLPRPGRRGLVRWRRGAVRVLVLVPSAAPALPLPPAAGGRAGRGRLRGSAGRGPQPDGRVRARAVGRAGCTAGGAGERAGGGAPRGLPGPASRTCAATSPLNLNTAETGGTRHTRCYREKVTILRAWRRTPQPPWRGAAAPHMVHGEQRTKKPPSSHEER